MPNDTYRECPTCHLRFLDPARRLNAADEKERYLLHENSAQDSRYVAFLTPLITQVRAHLAPPARGLDFGSGPEPVMCELLAREGYPMTAYDPFFANHPEALARTYDFIVCCEVAEHFYHPHAEFARLAGLLEPGGWLITQTALWSARLDFQKWHYRRDPTHVSLYARESFVWLQKQFGFSAMTTSGENLVLLQRSAAPV